jgi:uncharacterized damage-inducible protein DinB
VKQTNWLDRKFPVITDNGLLPNIIERLEGTPARVSAKVAGLSITTTSQSTGTWSIKKEIGHLLDLEPLWLKRAFQIIENRTEMDAADMSNKKTHETDHDARDMTELVSEFKANRQKLVDVLQRLTDEDLQKSTLHPRLGTPMRIIDLAYFVAEHDDHHLTKITMLSGVK